MRHHARAVKVRDLSVVELHDPHGVVVIVVLLQIGLHGGDAVRGDAFRDDLVPEEPQRQIDVVDGHVDEHAARPRGVLDEEAGGVVFVAGLAAKDGGSADQTPVDLFVRVAVGVVEAAGKAAHYFEVRFLRCGFNDGAALGRRCVSALFDPN